MNTISITKLELSAAQLLTHLIVAVLPALRPKPMQIHCWSDSRNVLCLLKLSPAKLKVFEANRVSDIITTLPNVRWKYVPTHDNPADCATRGLSAQELKQFILWWAGPSWLQNSKKWPNQLDLVNKDLVDKLDISNFNTNSALLNKPDENNWLDKFSSFSRLTRVIAIARRWLPRQRNTFGLITARELAAARVRILKMD